MDQTSCRSTSKPQAHRPPAQCKTAIAILGLFELDGDARLFGGLLDRFGPCFAVKVAQANRVDLFHGVFPITAIDTLIIPIKGTLIFQSLLQAKASPVNPDFCVGNGALAGFCGLFDG